MGDNSLTEMIAGFYGGVPVQVMETCITQHDLWLWCMVVHEVEVVVHMKL